MRTKKLLLTAALGAAVSTGAIAQDVFSVNVVGYVKLEIPNGLKMIANPLETANSTVAELFEGAAVAEGSIIYKFDPATGAYSINVFDFGEWSLPGQTLEPGEGAFFLNAGAPFEVTFVGEVRQGNLETPLPAGLSIVSSQVPQITSLDDPETGFPAVEGDTVYRFINETGAYRIHVFDFGEWSINPEIEIGESVFVSKVGSAVWARSFSVN